MSVTLQHLRLLREVARKDTISAAADSLGYTRSAVSQQLVNLEKVTGVAVLERVGRGVRLTDAGRELVRHADDVLAGLESAQASLERFGDDARGELDLGLYQSVADTLLLPIVSELAARHPELRLRTREIDPGLAVDQLVHGDLDLAFTVDYPNAPVEVRAGIVHEHVADDPFRLIVPDDHELGRDGPVAPSELGGHDFIAPDPDHLCGSFVAAFLRRSGIEPAVRHRIEAYPTTLNFVAAGQGIALIPELGLTDPPEGVRIVELAEPAIRELRLSYRESSADRPAIRAVVAAARTITGS